MSFRPDAVLLLHFALAALVVLGGLQDWRTRKVSAWICEPLFWLGIVFAGLRASRLDFLPLIASLLLIALWGWKWMGGADVKVLVGLWGLWPAAAFWGMIAGGIWGLFQVLRHKGKERFPAVTALAFAVALTILAETINIRLN